MYTLVMAKSLTFCLPFIPSASKNQKTFVKGKGGHPIPIPNKRVRQQWQHMKRILREVQTPDFGDDELELLVDVDPWAELCFVRVRSLGPCSVLRHTGRGRDIDNIIVTVSDGLQHSGVLSNDRQIRRVQGQRWAGGIMGFE